MWSVLYFGRAVALESLTYLERRSSGNDKHKPFGGVTMSQFDLFWDIFTRSGSPDAYLLYKDSQEPAA